MVSLSTDNGVTWTGLVPLNSNATTDAGWDLHVNMATDGAGNWVAVWESTDTLDGTLEVDNDMLVARFTLSSDCNGNGIPDECEPDCNANGVADECDIANCTGEPACEDCNENGIPDECDVFPWPPLITDPAPLNNNADTDSGNDSDPQVTTDGAGNWIACDTPATTWKGP